MTDENLIQWPTAKYWGNPWNPVIGCKPCSPACENCYAAAIMRRYGQSFEPRNASHAHKFPPRKGVVFCGNMTDLFGEWMRIRGENGYGYYHKASDYIAETLGNDHKNKYKDKAVYLWLTKRVENMAETLAEGGWEYNKDYWSGDADVWEFNDCDMSNQYFGFTAENQEWYEKRLEVFDSMPTWANKWVSCEPLLGPIDELYIKVHTMGLKWLVVGCESGPKRRPCKLEWVESIVEQCRAASVPVFVKQLDIGGKCVNDIDKFPEHLRIRQVPWAARKETK